jgi:DNA-binding beta-propeller fold protein YncE
MDETSLRALLDSAIGDEPPIGPVGRNSLRVGIRLRRRARMRRAAGAAAVVAAVAAALPAVTGVLGNRAAAPSAGTAYVVIQQSGTVVPIDLATNTPEQPIQVGGALYAIAITPDGKTAYSRLWRRS